MELTLNVAGVTFEGRQDIIRGLVAKKSHRATLQPEPDNPYDPDAVAVVVGGKKVGYVPKEYSHDVKSGLGEILFTRFSPYYSENLGCYCGTVSLILNDD